MFTTAEKRNAYSVGVYGDRKLGKKILTFTGRGIQIPGDTDTAGANPPTATGTLSANLEVSKSTTTDGVYKGVLVQLDNSAPVSNIDWPFALTLRSKVKLPGVGNNKSNVEQKTYADQLRKIETTGSIINDEYIRMAEDNIIRQIAKDTGLMNQNSDAVTKDSGAIVNAYRAFKVTLGTFADNEIRITPYTEKKSDATTSYDIVCATSTIATCQVINATATLKNLVKAFAISTTQIMIVSRVNGQLFDVEDGEDVTPIVVDGRYIMLAAKSNLVQFDATYDKGTWTSESFFMHEIVGYTGAGTTTVSWVINGALTAGSAANDSATIATYVGNVNTGIGSALVYASYDSFNVGVNPRMILWGGPTIDNIIVAFSSTSTSSIEYSLAYNAKFPSLTSAEVFKVFFNQKDQGSLSAMVYLDQPIEGAHYNKYTIKVKNLPVSGLHGAGYNTTEEAEFEIYVLASKVATSLWDSIDGDRYCFMNAAVSADKTFEALLGIWAGVAPSSW